jgi:hydroxypyruvate reductase
VLLSGGASALMAAPSDGITLEEKQATTKQLLQHGADIQSLNTVRKHLSAVKGGQLAAASPGSTLALAVSDVVGDDPSVIGSGPTVADASSFADASAVLERLGGRRSFPASVVRRIESGARGDLAETPKPGDPRLARAQTIVIGGRHEAMTGAAGEAARCGYEVRILEEPVVGEARDAARSQAREVVEAARHGRRPLCVISSGETTVRVRGPGRGGRNQEFALALIDELEAFGSPWLAASVGTDGIDGPTEAAGASVDAGTRERSRNLGLDTRRFLDANDAYHFFKPLDALICTGATGTNVGDLQIFLFP